MDNLGDLVLSGPLLLAIPIAMAAGLVSFLSPCCLPLLPGYLAYVTGTAGAEADYTGVPRAGRAAGAPSTTLAAHRTQPWAVRRPSRTVLGTLLFVLGFAAVFTSYGLAFGAAGEVLIRYQGTIIKVLGAFTILLGLVFTGWLSSVPLLSRTYKLTYRPRLGVASAPMLGVMFGIGWTPCIGPTLAAVLALSMTTGGAERGVLLSFAYSLGLGLPFICAALGIERAFRVFAFARRHARGMMQTGGVLLIAVGVLQVSGLWARMIVELQAVVANWQPPL